MNRRLFLAAPLATAGTALAPWQAWATLIRPAWHDRWMPDRDGLVPLCTNWDGWKGQVFYPGAIVDDGNDRFRIVKHRPEMHYAGGLPV